VTAADPLPHLLTIDQLVERLGTSTRHVRRLIAERASRGESAAVYQRRLADRNASSTLWPT
jgi:hypothetical protein